jgi:hypothetical protein
MPARTISRRQHAIASNVIWLALLARRLHQFFVVLRCEGDGHIGEAGVRDQVGLLFELLTHRELAPLDRPCPSVSQSVCELTGLGSTGSEDVNPRGSRWEPKLLPAPSGTLF